MSVAVVVLRGQRRQVVLAALGGHREHQAKAKRCEQCGHILDFRAGRAEGLEIGGCASRGGGGVLAHGSPHSSLSAVTSARKGSNSLLDASSCRSQFPRKDW